MFEYKKIKNNHTGPIKVVSIYVLIQIVNRVSMWYSLGQIKIHSN